MRTPETPVAVLPAEAVPFHGFRMDIYRPRTNADAEEEEAEEEGEGDDDEVFEAFSQFLRMEKLSPLPTQTEDGQLEGFPLSQRANFKVQPTRTPPLSTVEVFVAVALEQLRS